MAEYLEYIFDGIPGPDVSEVMIALLDQAGYSGFVEEGSRLMAYIESEKHDAVQLQAILTQSNAVSVSCTSQTIEERNWNEEWEQSFRPVTVDNQVAVRATFHEPVPGIPLEIVIDPRMSFGTGHHATTRLMIGSVLEIQPEGNIVADLGCGTGVLAILAAKLKASRVIAVDIDDWAVDNCRENAVLNGIDDLEVLKGTAKDLDGITCDLLLANINRNTLIEEAGHYYNLLKEKGVLIISGFLTEDIPAISSTFGQAGFKEVSTLSEGHWIAIAFRK